MQKPYFRAHLTKTQVSDLIELLKSESVVISLLVKVKNVATHPEDDLTISTAVSAKADYFVTGDGPLIRKVGTIYQGIKIVTANDFLNSEYGKAIASQSALRILMKQDTTTIKRVAEEFNLSEYEQKFLLTCDRGEALLTRVS